MGYASYLLRLWVGQEPKETPSYLYEIESIQSGERHRFTEFVEVVQFLEKQIDHQYLNSNFEGRKP